MLHRPTIKKLIMTVIKSCALGVLLSGFISCGSSGKTVNVNDDGSFQENHGPFDANGNYREDWANKNPKRRVTRKKTTKKTTKKPSKPTPNTRKKYTPTKRKATPTKRKVTPTKRKVTPTKHKPAKRTPRKITPKTKPPVIYVVKKGDTLWGLSQKYKSTAVLIRKANNLKSNNLRIGQRLVIPRR